MKGATALLMPVVVAALALEGRADAAPVPLARPALGGAPDAPPGAPAKAVEPPGKPTGDNSGAAVELHGYVVDGKSRPVSALMVFAVERGASRIAAAARPDPDGLFVMRLPARVHDFGIMASRWMIGGYERTTPTAIKLVVYPAFPDTDPAAVVRGAKSWATVTAPPLTTAGPGAGLYIGQLTGMVTDETGAPLQSVRLLTMLDSSERLVSVTQTDREGRYRVTTVAGANRLYVYAPGLKLKEGHGKGPGRADLVLTVDTEVETITLRTGRRLAFRFSDSIYPEMLPPSKVAVVLSFDYGIALSEGCFCPGDLINQPPPSIDESLDACAWSRRQAGCASPRKCPASTWARACMLPQYWWLRLIQLPPPNPSRMRTAGDVPTMWWYDDVRAMQEHDAGISARTKRH